MHVALQIPELLEKIFKFSTDGTLAALIRTCRVFEDPSRSILWRKLGRLDPLIGLLPDATWEKDLNGLENLHHYPSTDDWARMRLYSSCITDVTVCVNPRQIGSRLFEFIGVNFERRLLLLVSLSPPESLSPMFPRLKVIRCDTFHQSMDAAGDIFEIIRWVNGPSVTNVRLDLYSSKWDHEKTVELTSSLSTLYPNATHVHIFVDVREYTSTHEQLIPSIFEGLFLCVRDWKDLVRATIQTPDVATFEHLSRLQSLTSFHLDMRNPVVPARLKEANVPEKPFPALTEIVLDSRSIDQLEEWLPSFQLSPHDLTCYVQRPFNRTTSELSGLCSLIEAHFCHHSLEIIELRSEEGSYYNCGAFWIRPLFMFTRLRRLILSEMVQTFIDDDELIELSTSWPLLEWLDLNRDVENSRGPIIIPTFRGLFALIKNCPNLRVLFIVIDTRDSDWVDLQNPRDGACNEHMVVLSLGNSPVDDRERVARILSALLPRLDEVYFCWSKDVIAVKLPRPDSQAS